eukprot:364605-Chlamydomonas_euryale.AAC.6
MRLCDRVCTGHTCDCVYTCDTCDCVSICHTCARVYTCHTTAPSLLAARRRHLATAGKGPHMADHAQRGRWDADLHGARAV